MEDTLAHRPVKASVSDPIWLHCLHTVAKLLLSCAACGVLNIHVVFGRVVSGSDVISLIENQPVDRSYRPLQDARISSCGELVLKIKPKDKSKILEEVAKRDAKDSSSESDSSSDSDDEKKKEKRREKKAKKKAKKQEKKKPNEVEDGELNDDQMTHPLVSVTKIDPDEIPDVPTNKFLLRGPPTKDNPREDRQKRRMPYIWGHTRSGRVVKGRGTFRFRTPSRSRSRSRSATPPHWKQELSRTISLTEYEKRGIEKKKKEEELKRREEARLKRHQERDAELEKRKLERVKRDSGPRSETRNGRRHPRSRSPHRRNRNSPKHKRRGSGSEKENTKERELERKRREEIANEWSDVDAEAVRRVADTDVWSALEDKEYEKRVELNEKPAPPAIKPEQRATYLAQLLELENAKEDALEAQGITDDIFTSGRKRSHSPQKEEKKKDRKKKKKNKNEEDDDAYVARQIEESRRKLEALVEEVAERHRRVQQEEADRDKVEHKKSKSKDRKKKNDDHDREKSRKKKKHRRRSSSSERGKDSKRHR